MPIVKDPVCLMDVDTESTPWTARIGEREYFFCSDKCRLEFESAPSRYDAGLPAADPPYTVSHGFPAPRFGSAASGGLENEPFTERRRISRDQ